MYLSTWFVVTRKVLSVAPATSTHVVKSVFEVQLCHLYSYVIGVAPTKATRFCSVAPITSDPDTTVGRRVLADTGGPIPPAAPIETLPRELFLMSYEDLLTPKLVTVRK